MSIELIEELIKQAEKDRAELIEVLSDRLVKLSTPLKPPALGEGTLHTR